MISGCVWSARFGPVKDARLQHELEEYAEREDLTLGYVFTDNGVSSTTLVRPGLSALLRALAHPVSTVRLFRRRIACYGNLRYVRRGSSGFERRGRCCMSRKMRAALTAMGCVSRYVRTVTSSP